MSVYDQTYSSFGGCDAIATFDGVVIGEIQMVSWSISREKTGIYTLGSASPRSFSRGKRGIAGTLVFTVFDRDTFVSLMASNSQIAHFYGRKYDLSKTIPGTDQLIQYPERGGVLEYAEDSGLGQGSFQLPNGSYATNPAQTVSSQDLINVMERHAQYADQLLPFDVTMTYSNEYGQLAAQSIYGIELLNEGTSVSIDDVNIERTFTYVAREITPMHSMNIKYGTQSEQQYAPRTMSAENPQTRGSDVQ